MRVFPILVGMVLFCACSSDKTDTSHGDETDTDAPSGVCSSEPQFCTDIGSNSEEQFYGCCWENVVYLCAKGIFATIDCNSNGTNCEYSKSDDRMFCLSP